MRRSMGEQSGSRIGRKKGAHYSAPMPAGPLPRDLGTAVSVVAALAAGLAGTLPGATRVLAAATKSESQAQAQKAESELQSVKSEIDRITRQVSEEQVEKDRLSKELRSAEVSVGKARESLDSVRRERAERAARRATLANEKRDAQASIARERSGLAGQLRAAYLIGHEEPLKLLLNQKDPARAGRMFIYYSYFGRKRADEIHAIEANVTRLQELDSELLEQDAKLAELEKQQKAQLSEVEQARQRRTVVLANLETETHNKAQSLERLRSQQAGLEKLLRELREAMAKYPVETNSAFG